MKARLYRRVGNSMPVLSASALALALVLAALSAGADTSFTSTGWLSAVPIPGITCTNGSGQVALKGNVHVVRNLADDALVTGRLHAWMDLAYQTDGTALFSGPAYLEVGTWDGAGTNFTPSGGAWALNYSGVVQPDGSSQYSMAGYGIGGTIEGLRFTATATRAAPGGPTDPYLGSGTIKPAPVNTSVVVDDFADNQFTWTSFGAGAGTFAAVESNQQLTIRGTWQLPTVRATDWSAWANPNRPWTVQSGQTIEARVDLVNLNQAATASGLAIYHAVGQAYVLTVSRDWIMIGKQYFPRNVWFHIDKATIKDANVILTLALTPSGPDVVLTAEVLDKASGAVLVQSSIVDTPGSDPTLTGDQVAQLTGCRPWQDVMSDPTGAPWTSGTAPLLFVFQDTDGTLPAAEATFDNFELRTFEVPQVGIEPAVRLTWLAPADVNYVVEGAPTPQGPWLPLSLPVTDSEIPGMKQASAPFNLTVQFFRLMQVP